MDIFDGAVQVLAAIPALAIVGYCVGTIVFAVKLVDGGLPVMSVLEIISARQLLTTGVGAIVPISVAYLLLGIIGFFVLAPIRSRKEDHGGPNQASRAERHGTWWVSLFNRSLIARISAALVVILSAFVMPVGPILGFGILGVTLIGFGIYAYLLESGAPRRTGEKLLVLLLCFFLTGLGAGIFMIGIRGPQFPAAERTVPGESQPETVGLLGTNGSFAIVVTCNEKDGFSQDPIVRVVDTKQLEITRDEFRLNPSSKTSFLQIITGWNFGLNNQTKNEDDELCGGA